MRLVAVLALLVLSLISVPSRAEVPIATVGPMTGPYASIGEQMRRGAEMAVTHINAKGGVLGQPLSLNVMDDVCDPKQATAIAHQLVNDKTVFVAGHFCSSASIPASSIYDEEGVIMITPASTNPQLTERGLTYTFRICGRDDQQGAVAAEHISRAYPNSRVAVLHDKTAYGQGLATVTAKELQQRQHPPYLFEAINPGERDFYALITRMKRDEIGVIYVGGYHTEAGLIRRQSIGAGLDAVLISGDALVTREYWTITGNTGAGTLMTFSPDPRKNPEATPVIAAFAEQNYNPEGYTLYNYAAIQTYAQAVEIAGTFEPAKVADTLKSANFNTVVGALDFDEKGDITQPGYVFYEWQNGDYDYMTQNETTPESTP